MILGDNGIRRPYARVLQCNLKRAVLAQRLAGRAGWDIAVVDLAGEDAGLMALRRW